MSGAPPLSDHSYLANDIAIIAVYQPPLAAIHSASMTHSPTTLAEIAQAAGVSTMTVSRALNHQTGVSPKTRDYILGLAADMGYAANRSAQKLSSGKSRVIGLLAAELDNPFIGALVSGAVRAAAVSGHEVLIYALVDHENKPHSNVLQLLQQFTDGVIALLPYQYGFVEQLQAAQHPVITIDHHSDQNRLVSIAADSYGGARLALEHLASLGHKRIAFLTGDEQLGSATDRHRAYDDAVLLHGLDRSAELVLKGDFSFHSGGEAAKKLLRMRKKPTAVFAANDMSAFGLMGGLQSAGLRIPDDISVVGFDDLPAAQQFHPTLTTVRQPIAEMGRAAVNTLLAQMAGLGVAMPHISLPTSLVVRASTQALKKS
jgi:LacI family transcriptional regulator